jgi:bis(5'-nucleosyl)-tetraphosphatase (symmetrical)
MRYIVGDLHGCFAELQALLAEIRFNPDEDQLWSLGDLVNRGPDALALLRFFQGLGDAGRMVLGNHDLYLLGTYYAKRPQEKHADLHTIFDAPDCADLLAWLRKQPLAHLFPDHQTLLVHAGVSPFWTDQDTLLHAKEAEAQLQGDGIVDLLKDPLGSQPRTWRDDLTGLDRYRYILNALTRMRYLTHDGQFNFSHIGPVGSQAAHLTPWFVQNSRLSPSTTVIFGHWASLMGETGNSKRLCLDTGCVYGDRLSALCLETGALYQTQGHNI